MRACFGPADILLPREGTDMEKWAVIACDQYTSQPEYWQQVEEITGEDSSTYRMIYPEAYIGRGKVNIKELQDTMRRYIEEQILKKQVHNGFVLTERRIGANVRAGLVGVVDLEQYEFAENASAPLHATEGTILSRIPPRVELRKSCIIESPHIMLLLEDKEQKLIEPLYEQKNELRKLYDFDLMLGGGHIRGYAVEGKKAEEITTAFSFMQGDGNETVLAVGDGNHSLAAAKAYWTKISSNMQEDEKTTHPARYALAEVVNLYSPAIRFEPIHRIVFGGCKDTILDMLIRNLDEQGAVVTDGNDIVIINSGVEQGIKVQGLDVCEQIEVLQKVLDTYTSENPEVQVDYIHGEEHLRDLTGKEDSSIGILLKPMEKEALFPMIQNGKILPRKAFSMGEAWEKRYYLECRALYK